MQGRPTIAAILALALALAAQDRAARAAPPDPPGTPRTTPAPLEGAPPLYREFKSWVVACDNGRSCFAKFVPANGVSAGPGGGYLSIAREAGPTGVLTVSVEQSDGDDTADAPLAKALRLDGKPLPALAWRVDAKEATISLTGPDARTFVRALRAAHRLTYSSLEGADSVSLEGLSAALLLVDEAQGRLGNETAFIRGGGAPASAVSPAPPLPVLHPAPYAGPQPPPGLAARVRSARAALIKARDCQSEDVSGDSAFAISRHEAIVSLVCIRGAYQTGVLLFRVALAAPDQAALLVLPIPRFGTADETEPDGEMIEPDYDPKTATLSTRAKGRGIADCGESESWIFDGKDFRLADARWLTKCGGPPGDWPTVYRSTVKPG